MAVPDIEAMEKASMRPRHKAAENVRRFATRRLRRRFNEAAA